MDKPEINDNRKRMCLQREDADLSATILGKRKSERLSTSENSKKSIELFNKRAGSRVQHISAKSRAIDNDRDAKVRNEANVNKLRTGNEYKKGTVRVKFKGERINRQTLGASLDGAHDKRSNWSPDQILVRNRMSEYLAWFYEKNIASSTNGRSSWYSEIAHGRAQHAGGVTDELGGQPASTHSNIEDMAREEGQRQLVERLGENVRIKSTIYVHNGGLFHGMVKASRHKLYILNESTNEWEKKLDHLQDGARGNITKDEVDALTRKIASLNSESPTLGSEKSKGIPIDSKITKDTNAPKHTHESRSFTGLAIGSEEYKGLDAGKKMSEIFKRKI